MAQAETAQTGPASGRGADGGDEATVHIAPFDLPASAAMSAEARAVLAATLARPGPGFGAIVGPFARPEDFRAAVDGFRADMEKLHRALVRLQRRQHQVDIEETTMGGVRVEVVTPSGLAPATPDDRVLVNLHGGAFVGGAEACGLVESIPVAARTGCRVVSVDYRQAYEHTFPAASEDVAAVYEALLADHRPERIGIFGYSAGGLLTAQSVAWFRHHGLPRPGAVAMCSAGAGGHGDSAFTAPAAMGTTPPPPDQGPQPWRRAYLGDRDPRDPLFSPVHHPGVLAEFPPTLLLTGTRSFDMSDVVVTHRALVRAGAVAELQVWDGLWHCFAYHPLLPESQEAYEVLASFFGRHLGR